MDISTLEPDGEVSSLTTKRQLASLLYYQARKRPGAVDILEMIFISLEYYFKKNELCDLGSVFEEINLK